jgi:hypothetical protein
MELGTRIFLFSTTVQFYFAVSSPTSDTLYSVQTATGFITEPELEFLKNLWGLGTE